MLVGSPMRLPSSTAFALPESFKQRKSRILTALNTPSGDYTDKSPKGSVDAHIHELIYEINEVEGWVTTSSCSGRVSVFVEGARGEVRTNHILRGEEEEESIENLTEATRTVLLPEAKDGNSQEGRTQENQSKNQAPGGPGGKGHGGHWLYVSHDPLDIPSPSPNVTNEARSATIHDLETIEEGRTSSYLMRLFGLQRQPSSLSSSNASHSSAKFDFNRRLIRLAFSPLILHVLCASLHHARYLLSAAINAGFRESGVQSLKALEDPDAGVMVAIRTAGLSFETIIGVVGSPSPDHQGMKQMEAVVDEGYLQMCAAVINERFAWNDLRRERLRKEMKSALKSMNKKSMIEDKDERQQRKKAEGLRRRQEKELHQELKSETSVDEQNVLDDELHLEFD